MQFSYSSLYDSTIQRRLLYPCLVCFYTLYIDIRNFQYYFVFLLALLHVAKLFPSFTQLVKLSRIDRGIIKCKDVPLVARIMLQPLNRRY